MNLLLTSVFGPFGVDDQFGRAGNKMELFHNQVTREQGIFSYRFNHHSFGLQFLAHNLQTPTTVLDFPSRDQFIEEIKRGYDYIGISFIVPNLVKAQEMARLIRQHCPKTKIILGGHGVNIPDIEKLLPFDHLCRGEGVYFLRELLGEAVDRPVRHPLTASSFNRQIMGAPLTLPAGLIIPGVGCANRCRFCATAHFFNAYTSYLSTGQQIYDLCCEYEEKMGITDFGVMDENFLKLPQRALELLELMEKNGKNFTFAIFSSAETLGKLGDLDILVRLGVQFLWIGVESKREVYEKNRGVDFHQLISDLRHRGISVLASAILFLEEHDQKSIWEDINFSTSLRPDYLQFMQLGPIPGTTLYQDYASKGKLILEVPYEEQHGQDMIWFRHPHFTREESRDFLQQAFAYDYKVNGASLLRYMQTTWWGYHYAENHADPRVRARTATFRRQLQQMRHFMLAARVFARNEETKRLLREVRAEFHREFGRFNPLTWVLLAMAFKEKLRGWFFGDARQPQCARWEYHAPADKPPADLEPLVNKICVKNVNPVSDLMTT